MKIEKINITKEIMDIPDNIPFIKIAKQKNPIGIMNEKSDIPDVIQTIEEEEWMVQMVKDMYGQIKKYLVKSDDKKLFTELIKITDSVLAKKIKKEVMKKGLEEELNTQQIVVSERNRIKNLPFWKRLLKQF